jgi:hypothetical protein
MHNIKEFNKSVKYYIKELKDIKENNFFLNINSKNENAFYSIAPLSMAIHQLNKDLYVLVDGKEVKSNLEIIWNNKNEFKEFIDFVEKKKGKNFNQIFNKPLEIKSEKSNFIINNKKIKYQKSWLKKSNWKILIETCKIIWKDVYNLKKNESITIHFTLIPGKLDRPINDLLDSYLIAEAMYIASGNRNKKMTSSSTRNTVNDKAENTADLIATILGCEYNKYINEKIFKIYNKISTKLKINLIPSDAVFGIYGKGVHGKHLFGDVIGYSTLNKKSKWSNPGAMFYKLPWHPQAKDEPRDPISRIGFTDTIPLDLFIETCNIDWHEMHRKNQKITDIMNECDEIIVEGKNTNFKVNIKNRYAMNSDYDVREKIDKELEERTGKRYGNMSNLPGGESFITPNYIEGIFYGDVVVNIDTNYKLNKKNPLIIKCDKKGYKIIKGPKEIIKKLNEKKKESMKRLLNQEKNKSLPKQIIELKKKNFNNVGEFAINTNPKAKLCDYLIVNEKIANMMHIALGSGFDADKATEYHYDIVFDSKTQKLNVYGLSKNKKYEIMKDGKLL